MKDQIRMKQKQKVGRMEQMDLNKRYFSIWKWLVEKYRKMEK